MGSSFWAALFLGGPPRLGRRALRRHHPLRGCPARCVEDDRPPNARTRTLARVYAWSPSARIRSLRLSMRCRAFMPGRLARIRSLRLSMRCRAFITPCAVGLVGCGPTAQRRICFAAPAGRLRSPPLAAGRLLGGALAGAIWIVAEHNRRPPLPLPLLPPIAVLVGLLTRCAGSARQGYINGYAALAFGSPRAVVVGPPRGVRCGPRPVGPVCVVCCLCVASRGGRPSRSARHIARASLAALCAASSPSGGLARPLGGGGLCATPYRPPSPSCAAAVFPRRLAAAATPPQKGRLRRPPCGAAYYTASIIQAVMVVKWC